TTEQFLGLVDASFKLGNPSGETYRQILQLVGRLHDALTPYNPRDMVDMQSAVWVAAQESEKQKLAEPFASIFENRDEAEWAFDLLLETIDRLDVSSADDKRIAMTLSNHYIGRLLRLDNCGWIALGFSTVYSSGRMLSIALLADSLPTERVL